MRGITLAALALALALVLVGCGAPKTANDAVKVSLPSRHYFLANGLEVVLAPDHHSPYVAIRMRYHVGSKDDPPGRSGFAHLVEHMTFACGAHIGQDNVLPRYARLGSIHANGDTWLDHTDYHAVIPSKYLENALWIESERMAFVVPALDDGLLRREIAVVGSERSEHYGNAAYGWLHPLVQQSLFPVGHPYQRSVIGSAQELATTTLPEVASFLRDQYNPDNATLALVGDIDIPAAMQLVETYFGTIPPGGNRKPPRVVPTPTGPARSIVHAEASVPYPLLAVAWLAPPASAPGWDDAVFALSYVTGAFHYRTTHLSQKVNAAFYDLYGGRLGTILELIVKGERGATFDDLSGEAKRALWDVQHWSPSWFDISSKRSREIGTVILGLENLNDRAHATLDGLDRFGTPDYAQPMIDGYLAASAIDVQQAVTDILNPDLATYIWIEPNAGAPPAGRIIQ